MTSVTPVVSGVSGCSLHFEYLQTAMHCMFHHADLAQSRAWFLQTLIPSETAVKSADVQTRGDIGDSFAPGPSPPLEAQLRSSICAARRQDASEEPAHGVSDECSACYRPIQGQTSRTSRRARRARASFCHRYSPQQQCPGSPWYRDDGT